MFGLSLEHLLVLLAAALFILGPERLPGAVSWLARALRQARDFASGAQQRLESELGPEFQQLRKPLQDLQALREFDPRTALRRHLLDDVPSGHPGQPDIPSVPTGLRPGERPPIDADAT